MPIKDERNKSAAAPIPPQQAKAQTGAGEPMSTEGIVGNAPFPNPSGIQGNAPSISGGSVGNSPSMAGPGEAYYPDHPERLPEQSPAKRYPDQEGLNPSTRARA